jgi:hypothetical protein
VSTVELSRHRTTPRHAPAAGAPRPPAGAIYVVDWPEAQDVHVYPVVADYLYPDGPGRSVRVRQ